MILREFTKIFIQCFVQEITIEAQDYVLAYLISNSKIECGSLSKAYQRFESSEDCLKSC